MEKVGVLLLCKPNCVFKWLILSASLGWLKSKAQLPRYKCHLELCLFLTVHFFWSLEGEESPQPFKLKTALQTHLFYSREQRRGFHTQKLRCAIDTSDLPASLFEDSKKVLAFEALHF